MLDNLSVKLWAVDPLVQMFQDDLPPVKKAASEVLAARNELETAQFGLRADTQLTNISGHVIGMPSAKVEFVGHVPLTLNTHESPDSEYVRKAPDMFPDPIFPGPIEKLAANTTLPIWITLSIPKSKKPGRYPLKLEVKTDQGVFKIRFTLRVMSATVPDKRNLYIAHWFNLQENYCRKFYNIEVFTEKWWGLVDHYAKVMAEHRQNTVRADCDPLISVTVGKDGNFAFDYTNHDRWVETFQKYGVAKRIEGGGFASREPWKAPEFDLDIKVIKDGKIVSRKAKLDEPETQAYFKAYFEALQEHLRQRGWLKKYVQQIAGEAVNENVASARKIAQMFYKFAPEIKHIEPIHTKQKLEGVIDVWVPQIDKFMRDYRFYKARQKKGDELWFYTCCFPAETYPNRFIDCALIKVRLLHWLNYRYGATGYLHWGLNQWRTNDPYNDMHSPLGPAIMLPPGDAWIVYPSEKHILLSSIRYEAMRDGIEDYELLLKLGKKDPKKAQTLAARMIHQMDNVEQDVRKFRRARRELLEALEE